MSDGLAGCLLSADEVAPRQFTTLARLSLHTLDISAEAPNSPQIKTTREKKRKRRQYGDIFVLGCRDNPWRGRRIWLWNPEVVYTRFRKYTLWDWIRCCVLSQKWFDDCIKNTVCLLSCVAVRIPGSIGMVIWYRDLYGADSPQSDSEWESLEFYITSVFPSKTPIICAGSLPLGQPFLVYCTPFL